ncbi:NAD(P)-dependent oxidoreductase [Sinanaerobacter chloroacetimidivorans]|uniref:NAD(P)-dependent oxidoreductase n=1 Tax=Sinanaerobacter chloroacetimidivorans TaxID=2818044 RepID=A0A8J8B2E8_9FIRM|nr:NAD(P)-dependent oxidoreductase [Sinanaerobacter chloroacetimidivorans]MBR0599229.1 NAD(P)-dependent oxidoreductase [Sinanaerobacter chloroacetimidivorans]
MAKVGWIGLGNMGVPMSQNLIKAGHDVTVWNRTKAKAESVIAAGAQWADSPKEIASKCDFIFTMVSDGPTLQAVTLGENGVVAGLSPKKIVIDMSTVSPAESAKVNDAVESKDCKFIRGPVTGSTVLAQNATLGILASGDRAAYDQVLPLFEAMGKNQFYLGAEEEARVMKLSLNTMIGTSMQMMAEAVVLAEKAGLDVTQVCEVIAGSAVGSPLVGYKVAPISKGEYNPAFSVKLMMKDFDLAFDAAKQYGVSMPVTAITRQCLAAAAATGRGEKDFSVLTQVLEGQCGVTR